MSPYERYAAFRASFQFRLLLLFTALTAVAAVLLGSLYVVSESGQARQFAAEKLRMQAQGFAATVRLSMYAENREAMIRAVADELKLPELRGVEISAPDGRVLVRLPEPFPADTGAFMETRIEVRSNADIPELEASLVGTQKNQENLVGFIRLYRGTEDLRQTNHKLVVTTITMTLLFWLLVSGTCLLLLRRVTASYRALMHGLDRMCDGNYNTPIVAAGSDEPAQAARVINELAAALKSREQANARLSAELLETMNAEKAANEQLTAANDSLQNEVVERERAREAFKNLVDHLPVGILWSDDNGDIIFHNRFVLDHLGYDPDEIPTIDQLLRRVCLDPESLAQITAMRRDDFDTLRENAGAEIPWHELKTIRKDGSHCTMNWGVQLSEGRAVDVLIDMTEHELLLQQLVRNDKLESLGVMAGGIAHNFNNVLTGVMGYISFATKFIDESNRAYPILCKAEEATRRAAGLANQLLTFARGGAPHIKTARVDTLVNESVSLTLNGSTVKYHLDLPPSLHTVLVDEGQICQVFNCLCINALQAMPGGGSLFISGRNVSAAKEALPPQLAPDGCFVKLSFRDQGCGIAEKDQPNIFTPYFTTKAEVGTGLGLATAHSIMTRHGGAITFASTPGEGTTFTLYLPAVREDAPEHSSATPELCAKALGAAVLVMDDEEIIRDLSRSILEQLGFQVHVVSNGEEALAAYRGAAQTGARYLAAILDLTIPGGMGGAEAARRILDFDPAARLIVSSGYSDDEILTEFARFGFSAAIPKPYAADELARLLTAIGCLDETGRTAP